MVAVVPLKMSVKGFSELVSDFIEIKQNLSFIF
jgi:hypothetical protein